MARVFVTRDLPGTAVDRLREDHEVDVWPEPHPPPPEALARGAVAADALLCLLTDRIGPELMGSLRAIANYAVGTDNIDLDAATERGIPVGNTPDVLTETTADLAWALLMAGARRLGGAERVVRAGGGATPDPDAFLGTHLHRAAPRVVGD